MAKPSPFDKAKALLEAEGHVVTGQDGRRVLWTCSAGHERSGFTYDVVAGRRCARCARAGRRPRAPVTIAIGTRNGPLEVVEQLGVVDGFSRIRVRNVETGVEATMTPATFRSKTRRWQLLAPDQVRAIRVANGKKALGRANPAAARHTWADVHQRLQSLGMEGLNLPPPGPDAIYDVVSDRWRLRCRCGIEFSPTLNNVMSGITRSCGCVRSHAQNELAQWLRDLGLEVVVNDRTAIAPFEIDVWIPALRLGVEYDGLHWHGEVHNGVEARNKLVTKARRAAEAGIRLVTVFEDEWLTRRGAVEGYLRAITGHRELVVGARQCEVVVDDPDARAALNSWHLQGAGGASVSYALRHKAHGLVAVMTFARPNASRARKAEPGVWELVRFAVRPGYGVPGGASRLLGAFRKRYEGVRCVVSYSDNRWSQGGLYRALGFVLEDAGRPSYWYFRRSSSGPRVHRYRWRRQRALQEYGGGPDDTEWDIMRRAGWDRIWDLGAARWVLRVE